MFMPPKRNIQAVRGNNRTYRFSWEDLDSPVVFRFGNYGPVHELFEFPDGSIFKFRAKTTGIDIQKTGSYDDETKKVEFTFVPSDTVNVAKTIYVPYNIDVFFPTGERYTILEGDLEIYATLNLNA